MIDFLTNEKHAQICCGATTILFYCNGIMTIKLWDVILNMTEKKEMFKVSRFQNRILFND